MSETTEIEIEVGQVWKSNYEDATRRVLVILKDGRIGYHYIARDEIVGDTSRDYLRRHNTLIKNADGTPIKQWKEIDAYEGMLLIGTAKEPICCQMRDNMKGKWQDRRLTCTDPRSEFPFSDTSEYDWVLCRVEVKND